MQDEIPKLSFPRNKSNSQAYIDRGNKLMTSIKEKAKNVWQGGPVLSVQRSEDGHEAVAGNTQSHAAERPCVVAEKCA